MKWITLGSISVGIQKLSDGAHHRDGDNRQLRCFRLADQPDWTPSTRSVGGRATMILVTYVWISFQTFSGIRGMSTWRTPNTLSASTTEFTIAGVQPIVPASPTPLTPSGFTGEGVIVLPVSIQGTIDAFGMA